MTNLPILQDKIEIKLTSNTIKYYESLGYHIPRYRDSRGRLKVLEGTKIIVDVKDLKKGAGVLIHVKCDNCGKKFKRIWRDHKEHNGYVYCKNCAGILHRGEKAYNWNPNLSDEERINGRDYPEYHDFVRRVLERDGYSCKICDSKSGKLAVHHLDGYGWCVEKRTEDANGITLCEACHNKFHSRFGHGSNTKEQFEEFIGAPIGEMGAGKLPTARKVICMDNGTVFDSAPIAAREYEIERNSLYNVLNRKNRSIHDNHFLWYDDYSNMTKEDVSAYWRWVMNK